MLELAKSFSVSKVFSDGMVLQRGEKIKVWGWAEPSEEAKYIEVEFGGLKAYGKVRQGKWCAEFDEVFCACAVPQSMNIYGDGCYETFDDLLIGDVFICMGQSNIRYSVADVRRNAPEGSSGKDFYPSDDDLIRLYRCSIHDADDNNIYPPRGTVGVVEDIRYARGWQYPAEGGEDFSAIGYYTAFMIDQMTHDIPIGLIEIDADGQGLCSFYPNDYADENELDSLNGNVYQSIFLGGEATPTRFVYNHFIAPFVNYPICGMIWYQGESDCHPDNASTYAVRFKGLIENYRRKWSIDFPVYMVELPSCYDKPDALSEEDVWAFIDFSAVRMEMGRIPNMLDKVYITASSDLWLDRNFWNSLHPYCKWGQAKRLSETILAVQYGMGDVEYALAPQMTEVFYNGNDATVRFKYKAGGLTSVDSSDIKGFEILINGEWIASKRINVLDDDDVIINADSEIMGVRYNAHIENSFTDEVNLSNGEGIPAIAFVDVKRHL